MALALHYSLLQIMNFSFPGILWALAFLAVPIVIHLFYFRRYKQILFTNVRFLKELVEETAHKNKLRNLLVLLFRILAFTSIILAFAQPYFKKNTNNSVRHNAVSIFIDNSWSMNASSAEGSLFNKAKKSALDILSAYSDYDKFQIISHEMSGKQLRVFSKQEAISSIEEIKQSPSVNQLSKILRRQALTLQDLSEYNKSVYLISDFQKSILSTPIEIQDSSIQIYLLPLKGVSENNIAIDSAYFVNPIILKSQPNFLIYSLHNYGSSPVEDLKLSYNINGQDYPISGINIGSNKTYEDTIILNIQKSGDQKLTLKIADYPIQFDDKYFMSFRCEEEVEVLLVYDKKEPVFLKECFDAIPSLKTTIKSMGNLDYSSFNRYKLIVLVDLPAISTGFADELKKSLEKGTNLFVFPDVNLTSGYSTLEKAINFPKYSEQVNFKKEVGSIHYENGLFDDVFNSRNRNIKLPFVLSSSKIISSSFSEPILSFKDGSSFVLRYGVRNSFVYCCSSPSNPELNSLSKNAEIFLPLLFKACISGKNTNKCSYTIGREQMISLPMKEIITLKDNTIQFKGPDEFITSAKLTPDQLNIDVYEELKTSGIYDLYNQSYLLGSIAFNEDRTESNLAFFSDDQIIEKFGKSSQLIDRSSIGNLTASIQDANEKQSLWWYLILLGILFLICESLIIRFWKNN